MVDEAQNIPNDEALINPENASSFDFVPFIWLLLIVGAYAYSQGLTTEDLKNKFTNLFKSKGSSEKKQNFESQATSQALNSRQAYLDKLQSQIDSTSASRKKEREEKERKQAQDKALDKINKQQAVLKGEHYSSPGHSMNEEEEKKRKEIEELLRLKKLKSNRNDGGNRRTIRDNDFNPLGNTNDSDTCRWRPGQGSSAARSGG